MGVELSVCMANKLQLKSMPVVQELHFKYKTLEQPRRDRLRH